MTRSKLPERRPSETISATFKSQKISITVGFDPISGKPREVFANGPKEGTDMAHAIADSCVIISIALQHGVTPQELAKSLGEIPGFTGPEPASVVGMIVGALNNG